MYFEDFRTGTTLTTPSRTVSGDDVTRFIDLVGLHNPIFMTDEGARAAGHPARLVPGPFQLSIAMGLAQAGGLFDAVVAVAQFNELKFRRPVHPGMELTLEADVLETSPTSNPTRGRVILDYQLLADGIPSLTATGIYLMLRRPDPE